MSVELANPAGLLESPVYSQLAVARGSQILFISGQVGFDSDGNLVGADHGAQAEQAFRNLVIAVESQGGSAADIAKITIFVVGHSPELAQPILAGRDAVFGNHKPASTFLGVEKLIRPELLVEVEGTAVLG